MTKNLCQQDNCFISFMTSNEHYWVVKSENKRELGLTWKCLEGLTYKIHLHLYSIRIIHYVHHMFSRCTLGVNKWFFAYSVFVLIL